MVLQIEKTIVTITYPDGSVRRGFMPLPPTQKQEMLTVYDDEKMLKGAIVNLSAVRELQFEMIAKGNPAISAGHHGRAPSHYPTEPNKE